MVKKQSFVFAGAAARNVESDNSFAEKAADAGTQQPARVKCQPFCS
jgi:hypothetical protein